MCRHWPGTSPPEQRLHSDIDEDRLESGRDDCPQSRSGVARAAAKYPHEAEREPEQTEIAECRSGVEETVRDRLATQQGEEVVDPSVEGLDPTSSGIRVEPAERTHQAGELPEPTPAASNAEASGAGDGPAVAAGVPNAEAASAGSPPKDGQ